MCHRIIVCIGKWIESLVPALCMLERSIESNYLQNIYRVRTSIAPNQTRIQSQWINRTTQREKEEIKRPLNQRLPANTTNTQQQIIKILFVRFDCSWAFQRELSIWKLMRSRICRHAFLPSVYLFRMKMGKDDAIVWQLTTATHTTHNYKLHIHTVCP